MKILTAFISGICRHCFCLRRHFLKDKFLSEKYARRVAVILILALPAFYTCFAGTGYGFSRAFSRNISFSCSGRCLCGRRWKRRLEFWQQWSGQFRSAGAGNVLLPVEIYDNPYIDLGMSYVIMRLRSVSAWEFWRYVFCGTGTWDALRSLAKIRCGTICIISRFAVPCWDASV